MEIYLIIRSLNHVVAKGWVRRVPLHEHSANPLKVRNERTPRKFALQWHSVHAIRADKNLNVLSTLKPISGNVGTNLIDCFPYPKRLVVQVCVSWFRISK